jgi:hypothetical protein
MNLSLVNRGLVSSTQMEEALARQILYGGDVLLNLFELHSFDETAILVALCEESQLHPAPSGILPPPAADAMALLSPSRAIELGVLPVAVQRGALVVVVDAPLSQEAEWQLGSMAGRPVEQRLALSFRLREGLSRTYGIPMPKRIERLLTRLSGGRGELASPPSLPPPPLPRADAIPTKTRHRGPYPVEELAADAAESPTRDALFSLYFDFVAQFFDYSVLLVVHEPAAGSPKGEDVAEASHARGDGPRGSLLRSVSIPMQDTGILAAARRSRAPQLGRLTTDPADVELARRLDRPPGIFALALPFVVRQKVVALLFGDFGGDPMDYAQIQDVVRASEAVSAALLRMLTARPGDVARASRLPPPALPPSAVTFNPKATAKSLDTTQPAVPARIQASRVHIASAPPPLAIEDSPRIKSVHPQGPPLPREEPSSPAMDVDFEEEAVSRSTLAASSLPKRRVNAEVDVWRPDDGSYEAPRPSGGRPAAGAPAVEVWQPGGRAPVASQRGSELRTPSSAGMPIDVWQPGMPIPDVQPAPQSQAASSGRLPQQAYSAAKAVVSSGPVSRKPIVDDEPSIILDVEIDHTDLVDLAIAGDAEAEAELLRLGAEAMPALVDRFPGPLTKEIPEQGAMPRAGDCGPVLRVLARQRKVALASIMPFCQDANVVKRRYAMLLLIDLPYIDALDVAALAAGDDDPRVRRIAALVLARLAVDAPRAVAERLMRAAKDPDASPPKRIRILEAVGSVGQPIAVPMVLPLVGDGLAQVGEAARRALVRLTGQDFRLDSRKWSGWWTSNVGRHRYEWLIDAVLQDDPRLRKEALDELSGPVGRPLAMEVDAGPERREAMHLELMRWWNSVGVKKFVEGLE